MSTLDNRGRLRAHVGIGHGERISWDLVGRRRLFAPGVSSRRHAVDFRHGLTVGCHCFRSTVVSVGVAPTRRRLRSRGGVRWVSFDARDLIAQPGPAATGGDVVKCMRACKCVPVCDDLRGRRRRIFHARLARRSVSTELCTGSVSEPGPLSDCGGWSGGSVAAAHQNDHIRRMSVPAGGWLPAWFARRGEPSWLLLNVGL